MRFLFLILLAGCGATAQDNAGSALLFSQEITNYGITRYENSEVICYTKNDSMSCIDKERR